MFIGRTCPEVQIEVVYGSRTSLDTQIKNEIHKWIKQQQLDISQQDLLTKQLASKLDELTKQYDMDTNSEAYQELRLECNEMLNMQLTVLSLMSELGDELQYSGKCCFTTYVSKCQLYWLL